MRLGICGKAKDFKDTKDVKGFVGFVDFVDQMDGEADNAPIGHCSLR